MSEHTIALNRGVRGSLHLQLHISLSVCAILIVEQRKKGKWRDINLTQELLI